MIFDYDCYVQSNYRILNIENIHTYVYVVGKTMQASLKCQEKVFFREQPHGGDCFTYNRVVRFTYKEQQVGFLIIWREEFDEFFSSTY